MSGSSRASRPRRKVLLKDVNPSIVCPQCTGYLIDATSLVDCMHTFCRACILKHFEASGKVCPTCNLDYRTKVHTILIPDVQLQSIIYKLVGGLHSKEKQRRVEFYSSTGVRASSSCSDDSLLEDIPDHEPLLFSTDSRDIYSPDDSISLSLEYYQSHLDTSSTLRENKKTDNICSNGNSSPSITEDRKYDRMEHCTALQALLRDASENGDKSVADKPRDRRYLQCPAAVEMTHLQKFIRMKYGLSGEHKVDIIYQGEVLPSHLNLMDIAYSFNWNKVKSMRFFYRIFTHMKVQPIKIITATSALGAKQLQIVSVEPTPQKALPKDAPQAPMVSPPPAKSPANPTAAPIAVFKKEEPLKQEVKITVDVPKTRPEEPKPASPDLQVIDNSRSNTSKERLMAQLQLQPNRDVNGKRLVEPRKTPERSPEGCFLREYPEPDKEEIKRFAEKRDREWRMLAERDLTVQPHANKKRKKSKHSKSDVTHKKRKLHAEITPSDEKQESIKLKLKVTQVNGHKHKHRSSSSSISTVDEVPSQPLVQIKAAPAVSDSKQELLKLRGVRHKNIANADDKNAVSKAAVQEEPKKVPESAKQPVPLPKVEQQVSTKLRSDFSYTKPGKDASEEQRQQTFLKTLQSSTKEHKSAAAKVASAPENEKAAPGPKVNNSTGSSNKLPTSASLNSNNNSLQNAFVNNQKAIERKLAIIKQECTVETKRNLVAAKPDRKVTFGPDHKPTAPADKLKIHPAKPKIVSSQFTTNPGFTVSKIDSSPQGIKRKFDKPAQITDHRPSLEITVIPQSPAAPQPIYTKNPGSAALHQVARRPPPSPSGKRPPPDTIPLDRIIKSNAAALSKAGVSITPSKPGAETSAGVLDLSQKLTTIELAKGHGNGLKAPPPASDNKGLSNLHMLSKVATEQVPSKPPPPPPKLVRPQIPNLQSIGSFHPKPMPNLTKIPKLNDMAQFRNAQANNGGSMILTMVRAQLQNQSIRNIPNPSLLVRQQNQNRLNMAGAAPAADKPKQPQPLNNGFKDQLSAKSVVVIESRDKVDSLMASAGKS